MSTREARTAIELQRPHYVARSSRPWLPVAIVAAIAAILSSSILLLLR